MITIFTTCRSFEYPEFALNQRNAIGSWLQIYPKPQILVLGDESGEPGVREFCKTVGVEYVPDLLVSKSRAPRLDSMIALAEQYGSYDVLLLASSDIILFSDVLVAAQILHERLGSFVAGVVRYNSDVNTPINFTDGNWVEDVRKQAVPGSPSCGDFYMFSRGFFRNDMLPLYWGRGFVDFWTNMYGLQRGRLIDLTEMVMAVHQNHGHPHVGGTAAMGENEDFLENKKLAAGRGNLITHTPFVLKANGDIATRTVDWMAK